MDQPSEEPDLIKQLLLSSHLSMDDRSRLPIGHARLSVILKIVLDALEQCGHFPPVEPFLGVYSTPIIVREAEGFKVLHYGEVGMARFALCGSAQFASLKDAFKQYLQWTYGSAYQKEVGDNIDRVPIAWDQ